MLCLGNQFISAKNINCTYFKNPKQWAGNLNAATPDRKKIKIKVLFLQEKLAWQQIHLRYKLDGKINNIYLTGDCFASSSGDISIKAMDSKKQATSVLFITYQTHTGNLDIGTGMLPLDTNNKKSRRSVGSISGLLKPVTVKKLHP
jgi:hypothetical protein